MGRSPEGGQEGASWSLAGQPAGLTEEQVQRPCGSSALSRGTERNVNAVVGCGGFHLCAPHRYSPSSCYG